MTREEELDWLCRLRSEIYVYMPKEWLIPMNNALDMAISALSADGEYIKKEDAIEHLNDLFGEMYLVSFDDVVQSVDSLQTYSFPDSAENKDGWIPVSERLPEIHQDVLLELRSGEMLTGFKAETEPYFYVIGVDGCYVEPENVIAWQPLPKPYKTESEEV